MITSILSFSKFSSLPAQGQLISTYTICHLQINANWNKSKFLSAMISWLVLLGFNATLTAKVILWRTVTHMFPGFLTPVLTQFFLSKATDYFSHMLLQRQEVKIRLKEKSPQPGIKLTTTWS